MAIPVTVKRKAPRLSADIATDINVLPKSTEVRTRLDYRVQFAGIDTFQLQVPEAISASLRIKAIQADPASPAIKFSKPSDPQDGWVTWTVVMQREVVGVQRARHLFVRGRAARATAAVVVRIDQRGDVALQAGFAAVGGARHGSPELLGRDLDHRRVRDTGGGGRIVRATDEDCQRETDCNEGRFEAT